MKTFAEYLVESKTVEARALVIALVDSLKAAPHPAEIALQKGLLSPEQLLQIFVVQSQKGADFSSACRELNLWNEPLEQELKLELERRKSSFTVFLVQKGVLTTESLLQALQQYQLGGASLPLADNKPVAAVAIAAAAPSSESTRLKSIWTDERHADLVRLLSVAPAARSAEQQEQIAESFLKLKGMARFLKISSLEEALQGFEGNFPSEAAEILTRLREHLLNGGAALASRSPTTTTSSSEKRILVVDDSKVVHSFLSECLAGEPYQLDFAFNGKEALAKLSQGNRYDVIFLDWEMPELNGPDTFTELRSRGIQIPVVMMTSRSSVTDIEVMLSRGVSEYIMKPFNREILVDKLAILASAGEDLHVAA